MVTNQCHNHATPPPIMQDIAAVGNGAGKNENAHFHHRCGVEMTPLIGIGASNIVGKPACIGSPRPDFPTRERDATIKLRWRACVADVANSTHRAGGSICKNSAWRRRKDATQRTDMVTSNAQVLNAALYHALVITDHQREGQPAARNFKKTTT